MLNWNFNGSFMTWTLDKIVWYARLVMCIIRAFRWVINSPKFELFCPSPKMDSKLLMDNHLRQERRAHLSRGQLGRGGVFSENRQISLTCKNLQFIFWISLSNPSTVSKDVASLSSGSIPTCWLSLHWNYRLVSSPQRKNVVCVFVCGGFLLLCPDTQLLRNSTSRTILLFKAASNWPIYRFSLMEALIKKRD